MTDRPIIFSAPMVRALLAGRKTQTRRVLKLPKKTFSGGPIYERPDMGGWEATTSGGGGCFMIVKGEKIPAPEKVAIWHRTTGVCMEVPFQAGDRLWVRENCAAEERETDNIDGVRYVADQAFAKIADSQKAADDWVCLFAYNQARKPYGRGKQVPSIHMPRWASRLTLIVTHVRIQRLQDISEEDAKAEGIETTDCYCDDHPLSICYSVLWDRLHGHGAWNANPWIAALTFTVHKRNIDCPVPSPETRESEGK
jgi:hypothetical protein